MAETATVPSYRRAGGIGRVLERYPFLPALVIVVALLFLNGFFSPNSLSFRALTGLLSTYMALILLSIAQTYVVYAGDIDLSAGAILSLVNVAIVVLMERWGGGVGAVLLALAMGLLLGLVCGIVNGLVVAALRLQAIVATFATSIFFTGLALYILPVAGTPAPALFWRAYGGRFFGVPFVFYILAVLAILLAVLSRTRLVTQLLAAGDDPQAAYQTGLPVVATRVKGYVLCGLFSALAAFCITGDTASGDPLVGGKMTLYSVAAVVLGGSALSGGWGTVVGSLLGALTIALVNSVVFFMGTPSEWQNFVQGLAILLVLMAGVLAGRRGRS
ncbi:ABC transporter permease [Sinorhizobium medicae]|uniref:ABC transporter permease n=1 Tax=Sinorhizobium medicae TaxID=110321 RepID=UPI0011A147B9|nr:ABC transporter permease [Sinorhizobium medicae]MBO1961635.1 ABC transporter permease [Sinorhizobium medicae]TWA56652.1 monosaccharide ABC transporter membrane protein (CUT2 family) [Sinorhizobium medicae]WQO56103.1 ABC transporter permease [Sinorhizobium medicae]WQP42028.1 ABC transporter permease [Sinorhizobium medicae]